MSKAPLPEYRKARCAALRAFATIQTDGFAPDVIRFFNEKHGFTIRISHDDTHLQRIIPWSQWETARHPVVRMTVSEMLETLARADVERG